MLLRMLHRFEQIDLAREFVRAAVATIEVEHEAIRRDKLAAAAEPLTDEIQLGELFTTSMTPEIETVTMRRYRAVTRGDDQTIGLNRAIDFGDLAPHDCPRRARPRRLARLEFRQPLNADFE